MSILTRKVKATIKGRIFLIGCARSGTTLLQSMLMSHSQIHSFPETHFFEKGFSGKRSLVLRGYYLSLLANEWLTELKENGFNVPKVKPTWFRKKMTKRFIYVLDELTLGQKKNIWIEKTPAHINYIPLISKWVDKVKFIHIIRDGRAVVASMYEAAQKYPQHWGGTRSAKDCAIEWNNTILITSKYADNPDHLILSYEQLIADPEKNIKKACKFLNVQFEKAMITQFSKNAEQVIGNYEKWKSNNKNSLKKQGLSKYYKIFDANQRLLIEKLLKMDEYKKIRLNTK